MSASVRPPLLALAAIAFWSTNAVVASWVLERYSVSNVQLLQFIGASTVFTALSVIVPKTKKRFVRRRFSAFIAAIIGLVGTMVLQYLAFATAPVVQANIIAYSWPLLLAASLIGFGRTSHPVFLGCASLIGFIGVAMIILDGRWVSEKGAWYGYAFAIGSAICMAVYSFAAGRTSLSPQMILLPAAVSGLGLCLAWAAWSGIELRFDLALVAGLYLGAGPMGAGYLFWAMAMQADRSGQTSLLGYLTPVTSSALLWITGDRLGLIGCAGALIAISACVAVGVRLKPRPVRTNTRASLPQSG